MDGRDRLEAKRPGLKKGDKKLASQPEGASRPYKHRRMRISSRTTHLGAGQVWAAVGRETAQSLAFQNLQSREHRGMGRRRGEEECQECRATDPAPSCWGVAGSPTLSFER